MQPPLGRLFRRGWLAAGLWLGLTGTCLADGPIRLGPPRFEITGGVVALPDNSWLSVSARTGMGLRAAVETAVTPAIALELAGTYARFAWDRERVEERTGGPVSASIPGGKPGDLFALTLGVKGYLPVPTVRPYLAAAVGGCQGNISGAPVHINYESPIGGPPPQIARGSRTGHLVEAAAGGSWPATRHMRVAVRTSFSYEVSLGSGIIRPVSWWLISAGVALP